MPRELLLKLSSAVLSCLTPCMRLRMGMGYLMHAWARMQSRTQCFKIVL